ncbi:helix-turn-helix domain-containing protein [Natronorubrum halophilum]|uniref:helix-turn-helix domain-containing protein n=1 Tax=Natronorubrum halophilum TaxID=1702106 RepID=UPI0010C1E35C|nr:helix-turn-helix domain-containing protein [Natronorubrum halophilum]
MGFIAEIHLSHADLALVPTIERHPDVTLRYEYEVPTDGKRLQFISAFDDKHSALEEAMEADHTISNPTRIATFENRTIYRVAVETELEILPSCCAERGLFVFTITSDGHGWVARVHLPDRDALATFREYCRGDGISFHVTRLYDSTVSDDGTYVLTEQQHNILTLAYDTGYFDTPRSVTQDDLAEHLDISDSAVSQRLRRAVSELIAGTIKDDRTPMEYE